MVAILAAETPAPATTYSYWNAAQCLGLARYHPRHTNGHRMSCRIITHSKRVRTRMGKQRGARKRGWGSTAQVPRSSHGMHTAGVRSLRRMAPRPASKARAHSRVPNATAPLWQWRRRLRTRPHEPSAAAANFATPANFCIATIFPAAFLSFLLALYFLRFFFPSTSSDMFSLAHHGCAIT